MKSSLDGSAQSGLPGPAAPKRERPILFSGPMVRAILEGRKTVTRRIMKGQQPNGGAGLHKTHPYARPDGSYTWCLDSGMGVSEPFDCPYGQPGDRLWVREMWSGEHWLADTTPKDRVLTPHPMKLVGLIPETWYWADGQPDYGDWERPRPSIHMPRWASRLTLEVTGVKAERLQDITREEAIAEGTRCWICDGPVDGTCDNDCACFHSKNAAIPSYRVLWESINGVDSWELNPWVWAVSFSVLKNERSEIGEAASAEPLQPPSPSLPKTTPLGAP